MIDLDRDLQEAKEILEGRSMKLPTIQHLKALQNHHDDTLIQIAMRLGQDHDWVIGL